MRTLIALFLLCGAAHSTLPVVDYTHIAQDAGNEIRNLAQWTKTAVDSAQTATNTLRAYENSVIQLTRLGNPAALRSLPVIGSIAELVGSGQQALREYQQLQQIAVNSKNVMGNLTSVTSTYGLQQWNPVAPGAYQFPSASYAVSQTVQDQMTQLEQQRQNLQLKRDQTMQALQAATDQSAVQKYSAALLGVNGAIAEIGAREQALAQRNQLQQQQLQAGAAVQRQQLTEQSAVSFGSDFNNGINSLSRVAPNDLTLPHWPEGR